MADVDVSKYVGMRFEKGGRGPESWDCYGLLREFYKVELGIELPLHCGYSDVMTPDSAEAIQRGLVDWSPVDTPEPWDAVLFNVDGVANHIGLVIQPGLMLHAAPGKDASIESYKRPYWSARIEGHYTWPQ